LTKESETSTSGDQYDCTTTKSEFLKGYDYDRSQLHAGIRQTKLIWAFVGACEGKPCVPLGITKQHLNAMSAAVGEGSVRQFGREGRSAVFVKWRLKGQQQHSHQKRVV